jgi:hypothetical protein
MTVTINGTTGVAGVDGTASTPAIQGNDTNTGIFFPSADTIAFAEGGAEVARFDSSGNLGIGTSSPTTRLNVQIPSVSSNNAEIMRLTDAVLCDFKILLDRSTTLGSSIAKVNTASGNMAFETSNSERMRIDSSGNVYMGATSTSASARINVVAGGQTCSYFSNTNTSDLFEVRGNNGGSSGSAMYVMPMRFGDSTLRGSIYWTGSAVQYNTSSDYRLKENIAPMTGALAKVALLKPCTYTWKESGIESQGFIAHELQEVVPECVTGEKDAVEEDGSIKAQGIDTSFLVATLTAAIQEQQAIITDLKARIETLENK